MKRHVLRSISILVLGIGVLLGAYSLVQIHEMNSYSSGSYLPPIKNMNRGVPSYPLASVSTPKTGQYLGTIYIPVLKSTLPIFEGTDEADLKKGVGHFIGSVLPGVTDNSVLAGHRDSVFSRLGDLHKGDLLIVTTSQGSFTYVVKSFRIVDSNDRTVIVPTTTAVLTLSTCYPFRYIGSAPKRFIVSAALQKPAGVGLTVSSGTKSV